ncbi:hypothetical protein JTE90_013314 [Oedothorax gibbosus]|uniref:Uncharacterized protein n=1 Tax=Oedothorax gibbosus TaxID=931172 RepID=A0AAV6VEX8_9ARAC|nr:hypothetical protein JTE90_013314 [Oedothorax gibbosus]
MGNSKNISSKTEQALNNDIQDKVSSSKLSTKPPNNDHIFLQQSVTLVALKHKTASNATVAPDTLHPNLFFGVSEDVPLLIGAIIGASLVIVLCILILIFWKCCSRMTILSKKKQYWLQPKDSHIKGKFKVPVVQSNSVVFLGLKPTQRFEYIREKSSENCAITKFVTNSSNEAFHSASLDYSLNCSMSKPCPEIIVSGAEKHVSENPAFNRTDSTNSVSQTCSVISVSPILDRTSTHTTHSNILSSNDCNIPEVIVHRESPAGIRRNFYSGTFDQHSLYSYESRVGSSEVDLKKCRFTWSNYSLRPASGTDGYYDLFQKANFCKKRKNRMRSDIAAAIALNRSQSPQLNKDTDLLVENTVEVVSDERTTL